MRLALPVMAVLLGLFGPVARAQVIYTCTAPDGTRIFSDERCGPDAKIVTGITSSKKRSPATKSPAITAPVQRSAAELADLSAKCDAGDTKACNEWTRGGGPALLREKERKLEQSCDAGQLAACEERFCRDGATKECRARVRQTAPAAGEYWYLRSTGQRQPDGTTRYAIRCLPEGDLAMHDIAVSCAAQAGPQRCQAGATRGASMSEVASAQCLKGVR